MVLAKFKHAKFFLCGFFPSLFFPGCLFLCLFSFAFVCSSALDMNLTVSCNAACNCAREVYNPVCGADGVMYYSPCHAGCTSINHTEPSTGKQVQHTTRLLYFSRSERKRHQQ